MVGAEETAKFFEEPDNSGVGVELLPCQANGLAVLQDKDRLGGGTPLPCFGCQANADRSGNVTRTAARSGKANDDAGNHGSVYICITVMRYYSSPT